MANSNNWGKMYCFTEFGFEENTIIYSIPEFSSAALNLETSWVLHLW